MESEKVTAASIVNRRRYWVRYQNNGLKRWDGKEKVVEGSWLEISTLWRSYTMGRRFSYCGRQKVQNPVLERNRS